MERILFVCFIVTVFSCASADITDFQRAKERTELNQSEKKLLDTKYVGFTKENFIQDFGKPKEVIADSYP